ncbi:MAG: class I poly(R)-hydroxyalkanoic acid synthase [Pseudobdellovibrionaceae bacterium]|jgi:polyhydroxyalkanoate synthase|nr:class I poly(R)-hydroxyalkanoic acid synthase [Pseudobdellovibrionaceae bacterium]
MIDFHDFLRQIRKTMTQKKAPPSSLSSDTHGSDTSTPFDPLAFSKQMGEILERLQPLFATYVQKHGGDDLAEQGFSLAGMQNVIMDYWQNALQNPQKLLDLNLEYAQNMFLLWQESTRKFLGEDSEQVVQTEKGDRRFKDPIWQDSFVFDFIRQSYLLTSQWLQKSVRNADTLPERERNKLDFYTRLFTDALAPTNFAMTNPEVLRETLSSNGQNLLRGLENLVEDLQRGDGELEISKTRYAAFEVGKNLATTAGSVIFQNDLMQLIQYTPSTKTVFKTPLLVLPPWINKYYILDMRPENSFIKWAVDQGHTVFVISWVNPDKKLSQKSFESYMKEGLIEALDQIEKQTGEPQVNVVGYCIGGTLLATSLAYLTAHKHDKRVASATFLTTLIDFHQAGDLSIFVDDEYLKIIDEKMDKAGYLEGSNLRQTFSLLRANDLIWSFVVNNYMLGKEPFPFDLLYWNDDSTNMPAEMHRFYLRNMYRDNKLCKAGGIKIGKTPIDVSKIKVPSYFISTKEDHIAPWKSTYEGMMLLSGKKRFVLAASGHVAGVINPPAANKYHYWVNDKIDDREHAEEWLDQAEQREGSWWSDWAEWVKAHAGKQIPARDPEKGTLKAIEPAPGSYIKMKGD